MLQLLLGGDGEISRLDGRLLLPVDLFLPIGLVLPVDLVLATALNQSLGLGSVVTYILLSDLGGLLSVLLGNGAELSGLGIDNLAGVLQLVVNELLVGSVDERGEKDDSGADDGETPVWDDLDEVV